MVDVSVSHRWRDEGLSITWTYVAPDELILSEEAVERRLIYSEISADWEELLEVISDDLQARQSAGRARLERRVIATERRVKVVDRSGEWCGSVSRMALRDIGDRCLRHEPFLLVPERLQASRPRVSHRHYFEIDDKRKALVRGPKQNLCSNHDREPC
jgi:hypothetical protein